MGNADTTDLWRALEAASGQPITDIARTWTEVSASSAHRHRRLPGTPNCSRSNGLLLMPPQPAAVLWQVPLTFVSLGNEPLPTPLVLKDPSAPLPTDGRPFKLNARGTGATIGRPTVRASTTPC